MGRTKTVKSSLHGDLCTFKIVDTFEAGEVISSETFDNALLAFFSYVQNFNSHIGGKGTAQEVSDRNEGKESNPDNPLQNVHPHDKNSISRLCKYNYDSKKN